MSLKQRTILILVLCLSIGAALRLYHFDQKSLWTDEVYTFNDSRDSIKDQLNFYSKNPTHAHPPLFFMLTHLFYPFTKPEREIRILPLVFGSLSIPLMFFLARLFSPGIAIPCTLSLTFMAYHISLSQEGRSYSFLMFVGLAGLFFLMKHLQTSKRRYLLPTVICLAVSFYTSYSSIPFITLSQVLWLYKGNDHGHKVTWPPFLTLNGLLLLFCLPWALFVASSYAGQAIMHPRHTEGVGSFWFVFTGLLRDWTASLPLAVASATLLILLPAWRNHRKNGLVLLTLFILPIGGVYLFCRLLNITHFIASKYFIDFMPLFLISLYLSLEHLEFRFQRIRRVIRLRTIFVILFIASNLTLLPLYYRSEKQDFRGLANYLAGHLEDGDKIFVQDLALAPGILHYLGIYPQGRHYIVPVWRDTEKNTEFSMIHVSYRNKIFSIYSSETCCTQYLEEESRLWVVAEKVWAKQIKEEGVFALKGYFDGSFANINRFPMDVSLYLFLRDPKLLGERGMDMPTE